MVVEREYVEMIVDNRVLFVASWRENLILNLFSDRIKSVYV